MKLLCALALSLFAFSFGFGAEAQAARASDSTRSVSAAPASPVSNKPWAVGVFDATNIAPSQNVSALFATNTDWIQVNLGVAKTRGDFDFNVGGAYKFTVAGSRATGFHLGPMASLGTIAGKFGFAIVGALGAHWTVFDHFILSVDAGPTFAVHDGDFNFSLRPVGDLLGLGIHYLF